MMQDAAHPEHCKSNHFRHICWSAVFVGALIGTGLSFLLNLFGVALGLTAFTVDANGAMVIAIGGLIGLFIAVIASLFTAGYAAGYLGRLYCPVRNLGVLYGFTTWTVALLLAAVVAGHVSHLATAYLYSIGGSNFISPNMVVNTNANPAKKISQTANNNVVTNMATPTANNAACAAYTLFALFFVGAISTCLGSILAMRRREE